MNRSPCVARLVSCKKTLVFHLMYPEGLVATWNSPGYKLVESLEMKQPKQKSSRTLRQAPRGIG